MVFGCARLDDKNENGPGERGCCFFALCLVKENQWGGGELKECRCIHFHISEFDASISWHDSLLLSEASKQRQIRWQTHIARSD